MLHTSTGDSLYIIVSTVSTRGIMESVLIYDRDVPSLDKVLVLYNIVLYCSPALL